MKKSNQQNQEQQLKEMANAIRFLAIDAVERANSGHPGMPMGMADVATILFSEFLKFSAAAPNWPDHDRFILSAGHGSMLLYALLYLTGYEDIDIHDLKNFRQLGAKTAGHPEYGHLAGIETTTGPLAQGLANAVGMALAEKMMAARFGDKIIDHKTYCLVGDGCLMEGLSQEAISIAGHLALSKLILLWDNNGISIDGKTNLATSENIKLRFEACNWRVIEIDGHNFEQIRSALKQAQNSDKPVMIACKTTIGYGAPNKSGSEKTHGAPLGEAEVKLARKNLGWNYSSFEVPENLLDEWQEVGKKGDGAHKIWQKNLENSELCAEFLRLQKGQLPDFKKKLEQFKQKTFLNKPEQATRKSAGDILEVLTEQISELIGGSADLTESVFTKTAATKAINKNDFSGRYIHYGVREHAMAAIMNGIALHKGFIPYGGTFLVFSDYMKPAIRLAAMMKLHIIYIFTHDSIGLGEDGPTHQPIEHLASLRAIPNLYVFRPCDANETIGCFEQALKRNDGPSAIILTRQKVGFFRSEYNSEGFMQHGGYIMSDTALEIEPDVVIIATGSEIGVAMEAKKRLHKQGFAVRVVAMTCFEMFEKQDRAYKNRVLGGRNILKVGIEAGIYQGWHRYLESDGIFVGMSGYGASGKAEDLFKHFGITAENVATKIAEELKARRKIAMTPPVKAVVESKFNKEDKKDKKGKEDKKDKKKKSAIDDEEEEGATEEEDEDDEF